MVGGFSWHPEPFVISTISPEVSQASVALFLPRQPSNRALRTVRVQRTTLDNHNNGQSTTPFSIANLTLGLTTIPHSARARRRPPGGHRASPPNPPVHQGRTPRDPRRDRAPARHIRRNRPANRGTEPHLLRPLPPHPRDLAEGDRGDALRRLCLVVYRGNGG
jgi:hypothetical protein